MREAGSLALRHHILPVNKKIPTRLGRYFFDGARGGTALRCALRHALVLPKIHRVTARIFGVSWVEPRFPVFSPSDTKKHGTRLGAVFFDGARGGT